MSQDSIDLEIDNGADLIRESWWSQHKPVSCWGYHYISKRIPFTRWIFQYRPRNLVNDLVSGASVAFMALPQSIAFAAIAGLPPQRGLFSEIFPGLVYLLFGSTNYTIIAPTTVMSVLFEPIGDMVIAMQKLATFLAGITIVAIAILQLGFIVDFISIPVVSGFTSATALTIIANSLRPLMGITDSYNNRGSDFINSWQVIFKEFPIIQCGDTLAGILTIVILILMKFLERIPFFPRFFTFISKCRVLTVIITGTLAAYYFEAITGTIPFAITGSVVDTHPQFNPPEFSTVYHNETLNFWGMVEHMGLRVATIPIVSIMQLFITTKVFSEGERVRVNQELMVLGLINILGSFLCAMPCSASFSRTAVNLSSGVRSPFSGVVTPIAIGVAIYYWGHSFYYIPKPVLAGVIISTVFPLIDTQLPQDLWRTKKIDLAPMVVTFICCLAIGLSFGILIGVILNLFVVLHRNARPTITCELFEIPEEKVLVISPYQNLYYPSAESIQHKITKCAFSHDDTNLIILNGQMVKRLDGHVAEAISRFYNMIQKTKKRLIFWNWETHPKNILMHTEPRFEMLFHEAESLESLLQVLDISVPANITTRPFYQK